MSDPKAPLERQFGDVRVPVLIVTAGLPGSGKSTIAEIIAGRLGAAAISVDPIEAAILKVLQTIGFQQTDYGRSLQDFSEQHLDKLDRRTTVIFLGDGRSNFADPRLDLMREIHDRSRAVIWLNPEPESYWAQGDSVMHRYARFCHVAKQCGTLEQLERIIDDVLRSYVPH